MWVNGRTDGRTDIQTDRQTGMTKLIVAFRSFAYAPEKVSPTGCPRRFWGQPPFYWVLTAVSLGVNKPGREPDHCPPSSAEVKIAWLYTYVCFLICRHGAVI
jgi:hypothetical protein